MEALFIMIVGRLYKEKDAVINVYGDEVKWRLEGCIYQPQGNMIHMTSGYTTRIWGNENRKTATLKVLLL